MKHLFTRAPAVFTGAAALLAGGLMAAPASAQGEAESMMVLGGYTNYTVSFTKHPRGQLAEQEGDIYIYNNTEIFFNGSAETDGGLQVSARVELEGDTVGDQIDEHYITVSGGFGSVEIGANDSADERTAKGIFYNSTGVDYWYTNADVTPTGAGYRGLGQNDGMGIVYTTPSLGGASFAIGYKPSTEGGNDTITVTETSVTISEDSDQFGDQDAFSFGVKYDGDMDGVTFGGSLGYSTLDITSDGETLATNTQWGVGVNLGFGDTTLYARHQDEEAEPEGGDATERKISSLAISHAIGPIKLGLGWVQSTRTIPDTEPGLRRVDAAGMPLTENTSDPLVIASDQEVPSIGELENEDTMLIGSVDYSLGSGVTFGGYVAWGETEQKGATHDDPATVADPNTGPVKDRANSESATAIGIALNLAF